MAGSTQPNFLILVADDARSDAFGFAGSEVARTPVLDELARAGTVFRQAFVTTSICVVSRASIFTGQYRRRHGITEFKQRFSDEDWAETYPSRLRAAGYYTGMVGKFGVGRWHDPVNAFDVWQGDTGILDYFDGESDRHLTARQADAAIAFLRSVPGDQPFCLSVSFKAPHAQDRAEREFPPDPRDEEGWAKVIPPDLEAGQEEMFKLLPEAVRGSEARVRWERRFGSRERRGETFRDYHRLIAGLDREIGRVLAGLRASGRADNTIVIFLSDNGFFLGERGLAGKWFFYDESIRIPLVIFDPRLPRAARSVEAMALNIDVAATVMDYAGVAAGKGVQGRSLRPWVEGRSLSVETWRDRFFYDHYTLPDKIPPSEGVRSERWAYLRWVSSEPVQEELYDMSVDPAQRHNLARDPNHQEVLMEMRRSWCELRRMAGGEQ